MQGVLVVPRWPKLPAYLYDHQPVECRRKNQGVSPLMRPTIRNQPPWLYWAVRSLYILYHGSQINEAYMFQLRQIFVWKYVTNQFFFSSHWKSGHVLLKLKWCDCTSCLHQINAPISSKIRWETRFTHSYLRGRCIYRHCIYYNFHHFTSRWISLNRSVTQDRKYKFLAFKWIRLIQRSGTAQARLSRFLKLVSNSTDVLLWNSQ